MPEKLNRDTIVVSKPRIIAGLSAYLDDHGIKKHFNTFDMALIMTYLTGEPKEQNLLDLMDHRTNYHRFTVAGGKQ
jgi:cytochrome c biogenesis protein ResB